MATTSRTSLDTTLPFPASLVVANPSISVLSASTPTLVESTTMASSQSSSAQSAVPKFGFQSTTNNNPGGITGKKGPYCIMVPCINSHPFDERRIMVNKCDHGINPEESSVKIGRSVVRLQPSSNNAIFDCKVLSRNHAILWQNQDGQFFLKDTRSSNGTFINNERLSASGEESEPKEIFSGDILQLGVEIVDNAKKVASGCVTCIIRLFNERGEECAGRPQGQFPIRCDQQIPLNYTLIRNDKFFILDQYIKEAKFREKLLGQKLQTVEEQLQAAQEALQNKWDEHINQELLLSRIELLESQLTYFTAKRTTNDGEENCLKLEIQNLMEDRAKAEQMAKDSLRKNSEQMQETTMRLHDAEVGLVNVEEECSFLGRRCRDFEDQLAKQREDYDALLIKQREDYDALLNKYNEVCLQLTAAEKANAMEAALPSQMNGSIEESDKRASLNNNYRNEIMNMASNLATDQDDKLIENSSQHPAELNHEPKNQCAHELDLKSMLERVESELDIKCEQYDTLLEKYNHTERQLQLFREQPAKMNVADQRNGQDLISSKHTQLEESPVDFQLFLLSTFPCFLALILLLLPFFHLFGHSWLTGPICNDNPHVDESDKHKKDDEQVGEDGSSKRGSERDE